MTGANGPIPARAGEPYLTGVDAITNGAYPRSRGGTPMTAPAFVIARGLSPLARGNLCGNLGHKVKTGPIPARAGEPGGGWDGASASGAYPRSRGGTELKMLERSLERGLSPLARGNPLKWHSAPTATGPIPARAGEPLTPNSLRRKRKR